MRSSPRSRQAGCFHRPRGINNPLEAVTNLLYLARQSREVEEIQQYLDSAERELRRVSVISNQTLRFYRQSTNPRLVPCEELIQNVLSIHQSRILECRMIAVEERYRAKRTSAMFRRRNSPGAE